MLEAGRGDIREGQDLFPGSVEALKQFDAELTHMSLPDGVLSVEVWNIENSGSVDTTKGSEELRKRNINDSVMLNVELKSEENWTSLWEDVLKPKLEKIGWKVDGYFDFQQDGDRNVGSANLVRE